MAVRCCTSDAATASQSLVHGLLSRAGDADLLMHYAVCREAGLALAGPPPGAAIGPVGRRLVLGYLAGELDWGLANAPECYAVLNACRALGYLRHGRIVAKVAGGLAALEPRHGPAGVIAQGPGPAAGQVAPERPPGPDAVAFVRGQCAAELTAAAIAAAAGPISVTARVTAHRLGQAGDPAAMRPATGVPGARAHRGQRGDRRVVQRQHAAVLALVDQVEMRAELGGQPLPLALVDAQQPERPGQLGRGDLGRR